MFYTVEEVKSVKHGIIRRENSLINKKNTFCRKFGEKANRTNWLIPPYCFHWADAGNNMRRYQHK